MQRVLKIKAAVLTLGALAACARGDDFIIQTQALSGQAAPPAVAAGPATALAPADAGGDGQGGDGVTAGAGFYYLKPLGHANLAFTTATINPTLGSLAGLPAQSLVDASASPLTESHQSDFNGPYEFAPRVWIGYTLGDGLGIRAGYWHYQQDTSTNFVNNDLTGATLVTSAAPLGLGFTSRLTSFITESPLVPPPTGVDTMQFASKLQLDVWDLEATQEAQLGNWALVFTGGVRYVHLMGSYSASRVNPNGGTLTFEQEDGGDIALVVGPQSDGLVSHHVFNGAGPTVSIDARRALEDSGFSVYGDFRFSAVIGGVKQQARLVSNRGGIYNTDEPDEAPIIIPTQVFERSLSKATWLPITEVEAGAQYGANVGGVPVFARVGVVNQNWFHAGTAADTKGALDLFGLTFTAGLSY